MNMLDLAFRLGLALAIGFVIGLERGWRERDEEEGQRTAGLRTFTLIGVLGGVLGALSTGGDRSLLAAAFAILGAVLGVFLWREGQKHEDLSATTFVAALVTFALGAFAVLGDTTIAAGAAVATLLLLANKETLHGWLARITWPELRSGLLLAAMTFIALPLLPDRAIDPWQAINPHEIWLMTILIAAVSFAGYAAVKIAGPQRGLVLAATLGGLVASTAVTLSLARLARASAAHVPMLAGAILASGAVMLLRVLAVVALLNAPLASALAPVLLAGAVASGLIAAVLVGGHVQQTAGQSSDLVMRNPFEIGEVLRFGALLAVVMAAVALARQAYGDGGLFGVAAISGLADVDALTLSAARLDVPLAIAADAILIAIAVNTLAKTAYAGYAGGARIGGLLLLCNTAIIGIAYGARLLLE
ncbi:MAG: MgtC/SapB family protein [Aestuariivirga sp.]|jgi:uncharacterized membrane protein (DUF4010 family)